MRAHPDKWRRRLRGSAALAAALATGAPTGAAAEAAVYRLDPGHTSVSWEVLHMGTSTLRARFDRLDGSIRFDKAAPSLALGITVDTTSLSSGHEAFDKVLRGPQLFATDTYPQATFVARGLQMDGDAVREVRGELFLKGLSRAVTLKALRWHCGLNLLFRREVCGGDFEAAVKRSDYGMTLAVPLVADEVRIVVQVEAIKDTP